MIKEIKVEEFNRLARTFPNVTFYQTSNWASLKSFTGWKPLYLGYYENNKLLGIGLFLLRSMPIFDSFLAYCPRGYLINYFDFEQLESFNKELISYLKNENVFELIIDPYLPLNQRDINGDVVPNSFDNTYIVEELKKIGYKHTGYNLNYENLQPRFLFRLPLKNKTYEEIEKDFKKETKRRVNKKDFLAISVRELKKEEITDFKDLMEDTSKRRSFIDRPLTYYKQMYDTLHDDGILRYMGAYIDVDKCRENISIEKNKIKKRIEKLSEHKENNIGKLKEENVTLNSLNNLLKQLNICEKEKGKNILLSVVCLLTYGKEAIMLLAGNDEDYLQHFNSSNIIVSELIKLSINEGYDYYNFYGITGNFDPNNKNYGLYTYKKQYGGEVLELIGQFEYTIQKPLKNIYDMMLKIYKMSKK